MPAFPERPYFTIIFLSILNVPQIYFGRTSLITITIVIIYWIFIKNTYFQNLCEVLCPLILLSCFTMIHCIALFPDVYGRFDYFALTACFNVLYFLLNIKLYFFQLSLKCIYLISL